MITRRPILVTGSHRSGTTWVGKMISASPSIAYIHEPFNPLHRPGICAVKFPYWFTYVTTENEAMFYKPLKNTLEFRFNLGAELPAIRSARQVGRMLKNYKNFTASRLHHAIPLQKDPIALFSAEWLAESFDMNVIVLVRHPAAFASSLRRLNWRHNFNGFLQQPLLMRDHLEPFEAEIRAFASKEHDILEQAALLWNMMHHMIHKYQQTHKDWIFVRHEDVSREPLVHFTEIFQQLHVDFSPQVGKVIQEYTDSSNPDEAISGHTNIKRNSKSNIKSWKKHLTSEEVKSLRERVEKVSHVFYDDSDW